jgi:hypothetical protein
MKAQIDTVGYQVYVTPYIKITHDKFLNGNHEFIVGWLKWQLTIVI